MPLRDDGVPASGSSEGCQRTGGCERGTKSQWRELCVSEVQVWGRLPPTLHPIPQKPVIKIGTLDVPPKPTTSGPLTIASAFGSCSGAKDESQWDYKLEPSWSGGALSFRLDEGASLKPRMLVFP